MPFSKDFFREVAAAASKLDEKNPKIRLRGIFSGFYVALDRPDIDDNKCEEIPFKDLGIDKEGACFLIMERLWGPSRRKREG